MFDWLLGRRCSFCEVRIPNHFQPITVDDGFEVFCSKDCDEYQKSAYRLVEETIPEHPFSSDQERRYKWLLEMQTKQKTKAELQFSRSVKQ